MARRFPVRSDDRRPMRYRVVAGFFRLLFRLVYRRRIHFLDFDRIPHEGPLLVAGNHLSVLDPLLMGAFFPRTLYAMAKKELFRGAFVSWMLAGCNTFPVDRGGADRQALRTAFDILRGGGRILIFVEGTRARRPGMKQAETGVGFLQRRSGSPVLPVAIWGTERALGRGGMVPHSADIYIRVGPVLTPPHASGRGDDQATADVIADAIAALLPAEYRGEYGNGRPRSDAADEPHETATRPHRRSEGGSAGG